MKGRTLTVSYAEPRQADMQQAQAAQAAPEAVKARPAARPARPARAAAAGRPCAAVRRAAPTALDFSGRPAPRRASLGSRTLYGMRLVRCMACAPFSLSVPESMSTRVTARMRGAVGVRGQPAGERERGQAQGALRGARQRGAPAGPSARLHVPHKRISLVDLTCARAGTSARVNACAPAALAGSRLALYDQWRGTSVCPPLSRPACARWGKRKL